MPIYANVIQLRAEMNLRGSKDDATLGRLLDAAEAAINRKCNRPDGFVADASASARYYRGNGKSWLYIDECIAVSGVAVKDSPSDDEDSYEAWVVGTVGTTTEADVFPFSGDHEDPDFNSLPYNGLLIGSNADYATFTSGDYTHRGGFRPSFLIRRGVPTVEVTARWGFAATVPNDIMEATIMQAARWYKRLQSAMADATASADMGQLLYRQKLDPDIAGILLDGRYVKPTVGRR